MPWLDPARRSETEEDRQTREELRQLLGLPDLRSFFGAEPTSELNALADSLRAEALRRRRVGRPRSSWLLAAAALPLLAVLAGLGSWGYTQKRRADELDAAVQRQNDQIQVMARTRTQEQIENRRRQERTLEYVANQMKPARGDKAIKLPPELVIPVDDPVGTSPLSTMQVKDGGGR